MNNRTVLKISLAAAVAVGISSGLAKADTGWTTIPSLSIVNLTGQVGDAVFNYADGTFGGTSGVEDANGNPLWVQEYNLVPQHLGDNNPLYSANDPNWGTYAGFSNSLQSAGSGSFTTVGNSNTFLQSINFGNRPPPQTDFATQFNPTTNFTQSGNYYPQGDSGGPGPNQYGNATPAQIAGTLVGVAGQNWNNSGPLSATPGGGPLDPGYGPNGTGTAGRAALTQTAGYANSNGASTTVNADGTFNSGIVHFTGVLGFALNFQGDNGLSQQTAFTPQSFYALSMQLTQNDTYNGGPPGSGQTGIADIGNNLPSAQAVGWFGRGDGVHVPQYEYVMHVPYQGNIALGTGNGDNNSIAPNIGTALYFNLNFTTTFTAVMNHPWGQGDANFDNIVNGQDIAAVASNWLTNNVNHVGTGDVTGDGIVNGQDIAMIASNWLNIYNGGGTATGGGTSSAVPEPGTWALLGTGLLGLLAIRRRARYSSSTKMG